MSPTLAAFVDECRADRRLAGMADWIEGSLEAVDVEANSNGAPLELLDGIVRIAARRDRSLFERFAALAWLADHDGSPIRISELTGWAA
jgi:hypothetical protein